MDTDGGDYPCDHLNCHLYLPAYLPRVLRSGRVFLRL